MQLKSEDMWWGTGSRERDNFTDHLEVWRDGRSKILACKITTLTEADGEHFQRLSEEIAAAHKEKRAISDAIWGAAKLPETSMRRFLTDDWFAAYGFFGNDAVALDVLRQAGLPSAQAPTAAMPL